MVSFMSSKVCEFGDFQTPDDLAHRATQVVKQLNIEVKSVLEPTCGSGSFLFAAIESFPETQKFVGIEINESHLEKLHQRLSATRLHPPIRTIQANFFDIDWSEILDSLPEPILVIGNPPWVTSATLGGLQSPNHPKKSNFQGWNGLEALTGKSNFDISEWMLLQYLEWFRKRSGTVAMLCKTSVARKVLTHAWKHDYLIEVARIYKFDAMEYFGASVDACFLVMEFGQRSQSKQCFVYESLFASGPSQTIGYCNSIVVANINTYQRWQHLHKIDKAYTWRSGIKHDCTKIMELERIGNSYRNGNGLTISLEDAYIYPLFKSSDVDNNRVTRCRKYLLVTQQYVGEDTAHIKDNAPATWQYLQDNSEALAKRSSSIYRNRPTFSIFGVGNYTFAPWKVAISGFYKRLIFTAISPIEKRPAVFDDTVYLLPCWSEGEAKFLVEILNSIVAKEFLSSMIFWSDKRPITIELLKRLNIQDLAKELDREKEYCFYAQQRLLLN
jgi:hypothetical protein